jgi:RND family efflux transporter MFP subunit
MKRLLWIVCAGAILAMGAGCRDVAPRGAKKAENGNSSDDREVPVKLARVRKGTISYILKTRADILPLREVYVISATPGHVARIRVGVGDRVAAGQVVAQLDTREQRLRLEESEAALRVAAATLEENQNQLVEAKNQAERARQLKERELISAQEVEQAESRAQTAQAQAELAKAQLAQREAARAQIRYQLELMQVTAPISGVVTKLLLNQGAYVSISSPILTIGVFESVRVLVSIPPDAAPLVKTGATATVQIDLYPDRGFTGRIVGLASGPDTSGGTLTAEIQVPNREEFFKPSTSLPIALVLGEKKDSLLVPNDAVFEEGGKQYVYTVEAGRAKKLAVKTGWLQDRWREIVEGVGEEKSVVVAWQRRLQDGMRVQVVPHEEERGAGGSQQPSG